MPEVPANAGSLANFSSFSKIIPLSKALVGIGYEVTGVARPVKGTTRARIRPERHSHNKERWVTTETRLAELGIFPGQRVEKVGSAGPGGATILKAGGSRVAVSPDLCDLILVKRLPSHR